MKRKKDDPVDKGKKADDSPSSVVCKECSDKTYAVRSLIQLSIALCVVTLLVYWQVGDHEFIDYDDNVYVYDNMHVADGDIGSNVIWAFTSVEAANWHPITWLSHMADARLYGMNPRGHHLTSVFIHTFSTMLLFLLLFRLTGSLWQGSFVAAMFALHPLHVESVAWVSERKDVLSALFCFLTLLFYASYVEKRRPALYLAALFTFVLGLMTKPMLVSLPIVMLLMDFWPLNRDFLKKQTLRRLQLIDRLSPLSALLKEKIPFFACSLLSAAVTIYAQNRGDAIKSLILVPFWFRIENAVTAYIQYLAKTILPRDLSVFYPLPSSFSLGQVICSFLILLLVSALTIWKARKHPYLAVGWLWFLVTLVPVIGLVQVGAQSMADRYTYIPIIGLFIMAAWGVPSLVKDLPYRQSILAVLACAAIAASAAVTWQYLGYWQDSLSLFRHALQVTSNNSLAHNNIACALELKGDLDAAIKEYREALVISPGPETHNNLGRALELKGDLDAAIREYRAALVINPNLPASHNNLGHALEIKGDPDAAIKEFREALAINPDFALAHSNLGHALELKGDLDAAIRENRQALMINPQDFVTHNNLGVNYWKKGDLNTAIREYQEACAINPNYFQAHYNLGLAFDITGDPDAAIREYQQALTINPNLTVARDKLNFHLYRR